jgi:hypothetical protein
VGKTTGTLARRWKQHRCEARLSRYDTPLYQAMRYFGVGFFEVEELARCANQRRLCQLERKFIRLFGSVENGYNVAAISYGGRTRSTRGSRGRTMTAENKRRLMAGFRRSIQQRKKAA